MSGRANRVIATILVSCVIVSMVSSVPFLARASTQAFEKAVGDRILDGNGTEVVWRGVGASYLLHSENYIEAWSNHLLDIQQMGLNTLRLAFRFPDSSIRADGYAASDTLNYTKLDNVLAWLDRNGLKAILDCHNCLDMFGDFGSQKLINDWVDLAGHFRSDPRIVAYELFNEPYWQTRDPSVKTADDVAIAYHNLTSEIRKVDAEHIVIWEAQPHLPPVLETISQYFDANMVFTLHKWHDQGDAEFRIWNVTTFSFANIAGMVEMRSEINKPFWLGEFGSYWPQNSSNPEWLLTNETLLRCKEQVLGWNLWMETFANWKEYLPFFPLGSSQGDLSRRPWILPLPNMFDSIIHQSGADIFEPCQIQLRHNNDQVTFNGSGLEILVITSHVFSNGSLLTVAEHQLIIDKELTIVNEQHTVNHPGEWKTKIIPVRTRVVVTWFYASPNPLSPNGDGSKDTTLIKAGFNVAVKWNLQIRNSSGTTLRTWTGTGSNLSLVWDGMNSTGFKVPDGTYTVRLSGKDLLGVAFTTKSATVTVDTKLPVVTGISVSPASFNPKLGQTTRINYTLSESCYVTIKIYNSTGALKRTILNSVLQTSGLQSITWNGKDSSNTTVSTGTYTVKAYVVDKAGNKAAPYPIIKTVAVDMQPPAVTGVSVTPLSFKPTIGQTTRINYTLSESCYVTMKIYNSTGTLKKTLVNNVLQANGFHSVDWNGKDNSNITVPLGNYTINIYVVDKAGNKASQYPIIKPVMVT